MTQLKLSALGRPSEEGFGFLRWNEVGLIPAIAQDAATGQVLMLAWMNDDALQRTLATGEAHFWSRSRLELWHKGATSGNVQRVRAIQVDCDADCLLLLVDPAGPACHTGQQTCFYRPLALPEAPEAQSSRAISQDEAEA